VLEKHTLTLESIIDHHSLLRTAARIGSLGSAVDTGCRSVHVDAQGVDGVNPVFVAVINCIADFLRSRNVAVVGFTAPKSLVGREQVFEAGLYVWPMHVKQVLPQSSDESPQLKAHFGGANPEVITRFVETFARFFQGVPNLIENLESTLAELMDNVSAHSGSNEGGWIAAKYDGEERVLRFSICDLGVSIPVHLRNSDDAYRAMNDVELLDAAFIEGVSGDKKTHFGSGLPYVRDATVRVNGALQVYSGHAIHADLSPRGESVSVNTRFPGTLIMAGWPSL
jgi:hypothetical protein